ncbi:hypothetical protein [Bradyrhizobium shewense]|nr:hypothetical protein [Bradyrhizobium shewense]
MSDDTLKRMLDDALQASANQRSAEISAKQRREAEMKAAGEELKSRVLPRLLQAQKLWEGKMKLDINDQSGRVIISSPHGNQVSPSIEVSATGKEHASYVFVAHAPGYVHIQEGSGRNRGNRAYEFPVEKMEQLTEAVVDDVLRTVLQIATGLKSQR